MSAKPSNPLIRSSQASSPILPLTPALAAFYEELLGAIIDCHPPSSETSALCLVFEKALDAMLLVNEEGLFLRANLAAQDLFRTEEKCLQGRSLVQFLYKEDATELEWSALKTPHQRPEELLLVRPDHTLRNVAYGLTRHAAASVHLLVLRDITEQRQLECRVQQLERELEQRVARLQATNQALRKKNRQLRASHLKYQTLFEILPIGVSITDAEGNLVEANPASEQILGIAQEDHTQRALDEPSWQVFHLDGSFMPPEEYASVRALREQRVVQGVEKGVLRPDGTVSWISVSAAPIPLKEYGVAIAYLDITAQKETEAALRRTRDQYLRANEVGGVGVWDWNLATNEIYLDPILKNLLGYEDTEIRNHIDDWMQHVYAEDVPAVMAAATEHLEGRSLEYHVEHRMVHKDGSLRWFLARGVAMRSPTGQPYRFVGTDIDITAQKNTELALQRQSQQERAFNAVVQAVRSSLDLNTIFTRSVSAISAFLDVEVSIVQYLPEEGCWRHLMVYNHGNQKVIPFGNDVPDANNPLAEQLKQLQVVQIDNTATVEDPVNRELAQRAPGSWLMVPIAVEGKVWGSLTLGKIPLPHPWPTDDIELAKRAAAQLAIAIHQSILYQQLQAANERYDWLIQSIGEGIWEWDCRTDTLKGSSRFWQILGEACPPNPPTSIQSLLDRVHPDDLPRLEQAMDQHLQQRSPYGVEIRMGHRDGHDVWIRSRGHAIWDDQGHPQRMVGTIEDVSDRKQTETALRQSEAKNRAILAAMPDLLIRIGSDGYYREVVTDPMGLELFFNGHDPRELRVVDCVPTPNAELHRYYMQRALETGELQIYEHQMPLGDGWRYEEARVVKSGEDEVLLMVRDISDRKRLEQELQDSRDKLASILNSSFACIVKFRLFVDSTYIVDYYSPKSLLIYGYSPDELLEDAHPWQSRVPKEDFEQVIQPVIQSILNGQTQETLEYRFQHRDGSIRWLQENATIRRDDAQDCWVVTSVAIDITARKAMELALRQREQEFRTLAENAPDCIMRCDRHYRFLYVNPVVARVAGIDRAAFLGKTSEELGFPEDLAQLWQGAMERVFITGQEQVLEYAISEEMGCSTYYSRIVPELDEAGVVASVLVMARDITALKQAQASLISQAIRERTLRLITQHIRETLDLNTILSAAVNEVQWSLNADRTLIFRINPDQSGIVIQEAVRSEYPITLDMCWENECFPPECYEFYSQGRARIVSQVELDEWGSCLVDFMQATGVQSKIVAPITHCQIDGSFKLWGLLIAHACAEPRQWQTDELELLQQVAEQLAIAIQQSELHQQVQQWATTLEQQVQERTITLQQALDFEALLKRITDRVRDSLDEDQILETAVQELGLQLNLECCDTGIYNAEQTMSTITHEFTRSLSSAKGQTFTIAETTHVAVYPAIFAGRTSQFCDRIPCCLRPEKIQLTILVCPIRDDQATLGDMWLMRTAEHCFSEMEVRLVEQVANQCAIALRQARLFKAAQAQVSELERLHQLKDDFLSTVSHELRTPMASIKMATELLEVQLKREQILPPTFPDPTDDGAIARYFNILKEEGKREITLIDDLLDLTRLDAKTEPLNPTPVCLQAWLPHLLETFLTRAQQNRQHLFTHLPADLPVLTTDLTYLQRIVSELLNNACKYTPPNESISLSAVATVTHMQLTVANSGVEIPEVERDRIFDRFYRIPDGDPWKHGGTGLGLALVRAMVEYLGGIIWVEADNGQTRFKVQLPLQLPATPDCQDE